MTDLRTQEIARLNDLARKGIGAQVFMTSGVEALWSWDLILKQVGEFNKFTEDNDPYGERDFGSFEFQSNKLFWKIDYYDQDRVYGSPDPADQTKTTRVLTIMLADEY